MYMCIVLQVIDLSLLIDYSTYMYRGPNPILLLSIHSGVHLKEVFNNRN